MTVSKRTFELLYALAMQSDWRGVERTARASLAQTRYYLTHLYLIQALLSLGRPAEADEEFLILKSYKFNLAERLTEFPQIRNRYDAQINDGQVMNMMRPELGLEGTLEMSSGIARWNVKLKTDTTEQFKAEAKRVLDTALPVQILSDRATASICTFGSCFAANLARMMTDQGMQATSLLIEESVNSTYANRVLMEIVCGEAGTRAHADMRETFGDAFFEAVKTKIRNATHIVLTVGVAPSFFRNDDQSFVFAKNYREMLKSGEIHMRTTSFRENAENLQRILSLMQRIAPAARRIVTVSPVPLAATAEMSSIVIADCVSKATLRTVVHEVTTADPSLTYFPAFEIVRWLAAYTRTDVYGADDDNSRHVSNWVVEFIVSSFIARFFSGAPTGASHGH